MAQVIAMGQVWGKKLCWAMLVGGSIAIASCGGTSTPEASAPVSSTDPTTTETAPSEPGPVGAVDDVNSALAIASMGTLVRSQETALTIDGAFVESIDGLEMGVATEDDNYLFAVATVDADKVVMTATSKPGDLPSVTGAVYKISDTETARIVCVTEAPSAEPPVDPTLEGTTLTCPAGSTQAE